MQYTKVKMADRALRRRLAMARPIKPATGLKKYRSKRDFKTSPEPTGSAKVKKVARRKAPRFCVQKHLASHLHYDFRLEHRGVLLSWAVPKGPSLNPRDKRLAMHVEDHPLDYGDFEGVIPQGYGAGIVMLWDTGTWEPESSDVDAALEKGELKFRLDGIKLKGSWVLVRTRGGVGGRNGDGRSWLLIKHRDDWAGEIDVTTAAPDSVKSFGDFADILGADEPEIWKSHRPAEGGEAGAMLREVIDEAAERKARTAGRRSRRAGTTPKRLTKSKSK
jgi:bifunctional non-homologous end joining protein LigD